MNVDRTTFGGFAVGALLIAVGSWFGSHQERVRAIPFGPIAAMASSAEAYALPSAGNERYSPPTKYQGDARVVVEMVSASAVKARCNDEAVACAFRDPRTTIIVMPNPCLYRESDAYAAVLCHELAHANGWEHFGGYTKSCAPPELCAANPPLTEQQ